MILAIISYLISCFEGCSTGVDIIGRMAASWNIPVITPVGLDSEFDNRTYFPTLTRLSYSIEQLGRFYLQVFKIYKWNDIAILLDFVVTRAQEFARMQSKVLEKIFTEVGLRITLIENEDADFQNALRTVSKVSRGKTIIYIMFAIEITLSIFILF